LSSAIPGRWAPQITPKRFIALSPEYLRDEDNIGNWRTIVALPNCPDVRRIGGRRKNKRKTRKHRRN
jgi:hypothetical protein